MYRKELALQKGSLDDMSEICNRIYRLENLDVLFQCLFLDQMERNSGGVYVNLSTLYLCK